MSTGGSCAEVASRAQQLLEQTLFAELRTVVATALSGLERWSGNAIDMTEVCFAQQAIQNCSSRAGVQLDIQH